MIGKAVLFRAGPPIVWSVAKNGRYTCVSKGGTPMSAADIANGLVNLCRQGQFMEAIERQRRAGHHRA